MSITEYFQQYREEVDRIATLHREARNLGQVERAQELVDELYEVGFFHYELMSAFRKSVQEMARTHEDPKIRHGLSELERNLGSANKEFAEVLNKFVSDTLKLKLQSD
jgi:hypothetical protein